MEWSAYWIWLSAALVLGILEILAPGYVLIGFAIGAAFVGVLLYIGGPIGAFLAGSLPITLVLFATIALISWFVMRKLLGIRRGQVKIWEDDINEN